MKNNVGLPLNEVARIRLKQADLAPNVPQVIKPDDLRNAVYIGLILCEFNRNHIS